MRGENTPMCATRIDRRTLIGAALAAGVAAPVAAAPASDDRRFFADLLARIASPVLRAIAAGRLRRDFVPELSPTWDGRDAQVAYLECFGRLMAGMAPWLALPADASAEGRQREAFRQQALQGFVHSVDPASPDYFLWRREGQPLVDAAFYTNALIRAPKALWEPLDATTKARIVAEIQGLRRVAPPYTNWLLFAAMNEAFLLSVGAQWDPLRIDLALRKVNEWYVGDGWYGDGPRFHFDYYGAFVIHPMLVEILEVLVATGARFNALDPKALLVQAKRRMQRFGEQLERMIGPDGAYPPIGRSMTYRTAMFQPLALLAWRDALPASLPRGQVRSALRAAHARVLARPGNFDANGYLTLGFAGHQPGIADVYTNGGSMYLTTASFLALGLPEGHAFWTEPGRDWTAKRAYAGEGFPRDGYISD